jgi:uncharacterized membrane protein
VLILWADGFFKSFVPSALHPESLFGRPIPGVGIVVTIIIILLFGVLTRLYFGKMILRWGDNLFSKIPLGRGVYKALKDFVSLTFSEGGKGFKQVAMIEYPRKGTWALVFVTSEATGQIQEKSHEKVYSVFLPTTPNPTSGYLLLVPEKDLIILDMKVEQAMKIIISAGVVQEKAIKAHG